MMWEYDIGALPVVDDSGKAVGMITDRDIAVRAVAAGKSPDTPIREVMSANVCYCFDDQEIDDVATNMADIQVRRLPVVNREKRLVGIFSLGDIARADNQDQPAVEALCGICEPGGQHSQAGDGQARA
jgi:CBS domain-containing protein